MAVRMWFTLWMDRDVLTDAQWAKIADTAFDGNALVAELNQRGARIVISQHLGRAQKLRIDAPI